MSKVTETAPEALLSITKAAKIMGVDRSFVSRLIREHSLPTIQVGAHRRIPRWALMDYEIGEVEAVAEQAKSLIN